MIEQPAPLPSAEPLSSRIRQVGSAGLALPEPEIEIIPQTQPKVTGATGSGANPAAGKTEPRYLGRLEENLNRQEPEKKGEKQSGGSSARSGDTMPRSVNEPHNRGPAGPGRRGGRGAGKGGRAQPPRSGNKGQGGADFAGNTVVRRKKPKDATQASTGQEFVPVVTPEEQQEINAASEARKAARKQLAAEKRHAALEQQEADRKAKVERDAAANKRRAELADKRKADAEKLKPEKQAAAAAGAQQAKGVSASSSVQPSYAKTVAAKSSAIARARPQYIPEVGRDLELEALLSATKGDISAIYVTLENKLGIFGINNVKEKIEALSDEENGLVYLAIYFNTFRFLGRSKEDNNDGLSMLQCGEIANNCHMAMILGSQVIKNFITSKVSPSPEVVESLKQELERIHHTAWQVLSSLDNALARK